MDFLPQQPKCKPAGRGITDPLSLNLLNFLPICVFLFPSKVFQSFNQRQGTLQTLFNFLLICVFLFPSTAKVLTSSNGRYNSTRHLSLVYPSLAWPHKRLTAALRHSPQTVTPAQSLYPNRHRYHQKRNMVRDFLVCFINAEELRDHQLFH